MKVWGVSVSYYTGKLEAYLRYKGIGYSLQSPFADAKRIRHAAGAIQVPLIERDDGRFMSDSTPIIQALEQEFPRHGVMPDDPVVAFIALLIEDYADEWLWRAAMHYRWSYARDRALLSRILADEVAGHIAAPRFLKLRRISKRQHQGFVINDGVTDATRAHVENGYYAALKNMTSMLTNRAFLLGDSPSIADFGLMGPMLRHFGQDPTPAEIMRNDAPYVFEWVARVWNSGKNRGEPSILGSLPAEIAPMLQEIAETHLQQLQQNAYAYAADKRHFAMTVQGCRYAKLPVSRYRVYCLEQLRQRFSLLSQTQQNLVKQHLPYKEAQILWQADELAHSNYDTEKLAPFNKAINVYAGGVAT